jgi:heavy metal-binding protein
MWRFRQAALLTLAALVGMGAAAGLTGLDQGPPSSSVGRFYCPMHPDITSTTEGKCSRCAMALVPGDPLDAREYLVDMKASRQAIRARQPVTLSFLVRDPETRAVVRSFATVHEKQFHLFVVSHDLTHYDHVHPEMQPDGSWTIDVELPRSGYYKLITDFLPIGGTPQIVPRLLATADAGDLTSAHAKLSNEALEKTAGSLRVALSLPDDGLVAGRDEALHYHVVDAADGRPVTDLEPYLAAFGHTLILSEDTLEYVHAHPVEQLPESVATATGGPDLTFKALMPKAGRYRLWTQLKRRGVVTTVPFTVTVASALGR